MSSLDDIIELYKRDVDVTLIDEMLRLSVEERIQRLEEFERFREELRAATERAKAEKAAGRVKHLEDIAELEGLRACSMPPHGG